MPLPIERRRCREGTLIIGGGQADRLKKLPPRARLGNNAAAFVGGFRLWDESPPDKAANTYKDLT